MSKKSEKKSSMSQSQLPSHLTLGGRLRFLREKRHITIKVMSDMLGINPTQLSDLEEGRLSFSHIRLMKYIQIVKPSRQESEELF